VFGACPDPAYSDEACLFVKTPTVISLVEVERGCRHRRLQSLMHVVLEYARNALGFQDAICRDPYASRRFIHELALSLAGRAMELRFVSGSGVAAIYSHSDGEVRVIKLS